MTTRLELVGMSPLEVLMHARKDGLVNARKKEDKGDERAIDRWFIARPQYNNPEVRKLINEGQEGVVEDLRRSFRNFSGGKEIPEGIIRPNIRRF